MGFIKRLLQEENAKLQQEQIRKSQQEARKEERLRRKGAEDERHTQRKQQAEKFREESGVGIVVAKLGRFLGRPTIPVVRTNDYDGIYSERKELVGRGSSSGPTSARDLPISQRDPDSVFDTVEWDYESHGYSKSKVLGSNSHHSKKYIAVESCPDGTIVFHAGLFGSTTIKASELRTKDKEQLFEKALEKAYMRPAVHRYTVWHKPVSSGFG